MQALSSSHIGADLEMQGIERDDDDRWFGVQSSVYEGEVEATGSNAASRSTTKNKRGRGNISSVWEFSTTDDKNVKKRLGYVDCWTCLNFSSMHPEEVQKFCFDLISGCNAMGLSLNTCPMLEIKSAAPNRAEDALNDVKRRAAQMHTKQEIENQLLLLVVMPENDSSFGQIEKACESSGLLFQYCSSNFAVSSDNNYLQDVALKINAKVVALMKLQDISTSEGYAKPCKKALSSSHIDADLEMQGTGTGWLTDSSNAASNSTTKNKRGRGNISSVWEFSTTDDKNVKKRLGYVDCWTCLNFSSMRPEEVQKFCFDLISGCNATGLSLNTCPMLEIKSAAPNRVEDALNDVKRRAAQMHTKQEIENQLLLLVVMPENDSSFGQIEKACESSGLLFHYCSSNFAVSSDNNYLQDVALKINAKVVALMKLQDISISEGYAEPCKKGVPLAGKIIVHVQMLGHVVAIQLDKKATVKYIANAAMRVLKINLEDVYFTCNGRIVRKNTEIDISCILQTRHRLRGGTRNCPVQLHSLYQELLAIRKWLDKVNIDPALQGKGSKPYGIGLTEDAQVLLSKLLESLEKTHSDGFCYNGSFSINSIWYIQDSDSFEIRGCLSPIEQGAYIEDLRVIKLVLQQIFRYKESDQTVCYPVYIGDLVTRIDALEPTGLEYESTSARAVIFRHPVTMSACQRIQMVDSLLVYYHKLTSPAATVFRSVLRNAPTPFDWRNDAASQEMTKILNHRNWNKKRKRNVKKTYPNNYFGWLDFFRCLITHAAKGHAKMLDAAIFVIWPSALPDVHAILVANQHSIVASSSASAPSSSATSATSAGAVSSSATASAVSTSTAVSSSSATVSAVSSSPISVNISPTVGKTIRWNGVTIAAGDSSIITSSSQGEIHISMGYISENTDLEFHHILGFRLKPCK